MPTLDLGKVVPEIDETPTKNSENAVSSGGVYDSLENKQDKLTGVPGQLVVIDNDGVAKATIYSSNQNLLDNWYLADPINQRGETEYTNVAGYTIDRWYNRNTSTKVKLEDDGIRVMVEKTDPTYHDFIQRLEDTYILGKTVTISALLEDVKNANGISVNLSAADVVGNTTSNLLMSDEVKGNGLVTATGKLRDSISYSGINFCVRIDAEAQVGSSVKIKAVKLELGDTQTLAHQDEDGNWVLNGPPPNKVLELAKCQRYFHTFATQSLMPSKGADFCPPMRTANPTLTTITTSARETLYAASSDL